MKQLGLEQPSVKVSLSRAAFPLVQGNRVLVKGLDAVRVSY